MPNLIPSKWNLVRAGRALTTWLAAISCLVSVSSQAAAQPKELVGATDHPLISRFRGAKLVNVASERFVSIQIPVAPIETRDRQIVSPATTIEGKLSSYAYVAPEGATGLEIIRSYQQAMAQAGFETLLSCESRQQCDKIDPKHLLGDLLVKERKNAWQEQRANAPSIWPGTGYIFRVAKLKKAGREIYVTVLVTEPYALTTVTPGILLLVAEPSAMNEGQVTIDTEQMQKALAQEGKVALYGLYFDTGKAEVKPESQPQLDEMAKLLKAEKALKVIIVGHTDNVGSMDANLSLSQRRAQAVVDAMVKGHGIEVERLSARGVASLAPASTNRDEVGRARNRRVELVEQ